MGMEFMIGEMGISTRVILLKMLDLVKELFYSIMKFNIVVTGRTVKKGTKSLKKYNQNRKIEMKWS
jgi:hypothetical protein